jgi:hypothetical protein
MEAGRVLVTCLKGVGVARTLGAVEYEHVVGGILEIFAEIEPKSWLVGVAAPPRLRLALAVLPITAGAKLTTTGGAGATRGTRIGPGTVVPSRAGTPPR